MNLTEELLNVLYPMSVKPLPEEILAAARTCLLDELGAIYGGARQIRDQIRTFLDFQPPVERGASVIGGGRQASLEHAALWGGFAGHVFDVDDGNRFCNLHPGSAVIPAVLAVCDAKERSMDDLLRGIVVGYEAATRIALCAQPAHRGRGFHASGTCGAVGAAVGAAAALGFDRAQMKSALAAAAASASGLLEMQENVSKLKPYNLGHAAMCGVTAVGMALAGFNGPEDPLGGGRGFFSALCDEEIHPEHLSKPLDGRYAVQDAYHKSYAACRHCHAALDSTLELRELDGVTPENIKAITLHFYAQGAMGHDHKTVPSIVSAKMSVPYAIALALAVGAAGIPDYTEERLTDPTILSLLDKITVVVEDELTAQVPKIRPAIVDVELLDGRTYSARTDVARGEPEIPLSEQTLARKFDDLLIYGGKTKEEAEAVRAAVLTGTGSVRELTRALE